MSEEPRRTSSVALIAAGVGLVLGLIGIVCVFLPWVQTWSVSDNGLAAEFQPSGTLVLLLFVGIVVACMPPLLGMSPSPMVPALALLASLAATSLLIFVHPPGNFYGFGLQIDGLISLLSVATLAVYLIAHVHAGRQVVGASRAVTTSAPPDVGKICPECAEEVKAAARLCRFCGHRFDAN